MGEQPIAVLGLALFCTAACHAACKLAYHGSLWCIDRLVHSGGLVGQALFAILVTVLTLGFALAIFSIPMLLIKAASCLAPQTVVFAGYNTAFLCGIAMHCADAVIADLTGIRLMAGKARIN
ncbi:MAG: hypothetical protein K2W82_15510 [Candidatus Obscuribacterales bacterium]|nr:hypothetical protein [Candidatus Obscuribacterales bacterium]